MVESTTPVPFFDEIEEDEVHSVIDALLCIYRQYADQTRLTDRMIGLVSLLSQLLQSMEL